MLQKIHETPLAIQFVMTPWSRPLPSTSSRMERRIAQRRRRLHRSATIGRGYRDWTASDTSLGPADNRSIRKKKLQSRVLKSASRHSRVTHRTTSDCAKQKARLASRAFVRSNRAGLHPAHATGRRLSGRGAAGRCRAAAAHARPRGRSRSATHAARVSASQHGGGLVRIAHAI